MLNDPQPNIPRGRGAAMSGKKSREKGAAGEREAARLWQPWFPHCKRMFPRQQQGVKFPDIGCPDMNKRFYVEVKRRKRISDATVYRLWGKLQKDYYDYTNEFDAFSRPLMLFREDGKDWQLATLSGHWSGFERRLWVDEGLGYYYEELIIIPWSVFVDYLNHTITEVRGE